MRIIVNFELLSHQQALHPTDSDQGEKLSYLYLGGKDLHDLPLDAEIGFVCDLLKAFITTGESTLIGRLDADRNRQFVEFLQNKQRQYFLLEGELATMNWRRRLTKAISQDYSQPWVFFEENDLSRLRDTLKEFWSCYGGFWLFLFPAKQFDVTIWKQEKERMQYDIWKLVHDNASKFDGAMLISDDYAIELFSQRITCAKLLTVLGEVAETRGFGLSTQVNP